MSTADPIRYTVLEGPYKLKEVIVEPKDDLGDTVLAKIRYGAHNTSSWKVLLSKDILTREVYR